MGNYLSYPALQKHTSTGKNDKFLYAVCEMQGWRLEMEDAHAAVLDLHEDGGAPADAFFAVYDGHGGQNCARYSGPNVHRKLVTEDAYKAKSYPEALTRTFFDVDEDLKTLKGQDSIGESGCTAVAALVTHDDRIFVANAGDSRAVLSSQGKSKPLSTDHKPNDPIESKRIADAEGFVRFGRVNGTLSLSRALGDFGYKRHPEHGPEGQVVTCNPDVTEHAITSEDEFLIVACDGIWDCLTSESAVDCVRYLISQGHKLPEVCELLLDHIIAPDTDSDLLLGCDNMTLLVVALLNGRTEDEWYAWVSERAKQNTSFQSLPQLYAETRLARFDKRKQMMAEREKQRSSDAAQAASALGSGATTPTQQAAPGSRLFGQQQPELASFASA